MFNPSYYRPLSVHVDRYRFRWCPDITTKHILLLDIIICKGKDTVRPGGMLCDRSRQTHFTYITSDERPRTISLGRKQLHSIDTRYNFSAYDVLASVEGFSRYNDKKYTTMHWTYCCNWPAMNCARLARYCSAFVVLYIAKGGNKTLLISCVLTLRKNRIGDCTQMNVYVILNARGIIHYPSHITISNYQAETA